MKSDLEANVGRRVWVAAFDSIASIYFNLIQIQGVFFNWATPLDWPPQSSLDWPPPKGAGSFHIHRKTMKELGALAVLGVREQPNLAQNLVTHRH